MANLTAEQLKALRDWYAKSGGGVYQDPSGQFLQSNAQQGQGQDGIGAQNATEWYSYAPDATGAAGSNYGIYDQAGEYQRDGTMKDPTKASGWDLAFLAAMGGGLAAGGLFGGAAGAAGAGGASSAASAAELAMAGEGAFGATNALGGAGLFGPAGTAYYTGTGALGGGLTAGQTVANATQTALGGGGAAGAAGAGGASSLLGGASALIGPAATALGALAGAKGNKQSTDLTKSLPDYLRGPVVDDLIPRAQGLLAEQMDPARQQAWRDMQKTGQGLLSQPMAGNGFAQFQGRKLY